MNSFLAVEKGLPPGLWLPTPDEPMEQYLTENLAFGEHDYEDIIDYGAFVVRQVFLERENTGRTSLMPVTDDITQMHQMGYGIEVSTLNRKYGGLSRLQKELGFYPRQYDPTAEEVIQRFQWIADYGYVLDSVQDGTVKNIGDIIGWGTARNLTPSMHKVYRVLGGDTTILRKMFAIELRDSPRQYPYLDLYRFGAKVIAENGGPISHQAITEQYAGNFVSSPREAIRRVFGSYTRFWQEFGYLPLTSRGLTRQDVANFGIRWAIARGRANIETGDINRLSKEMKFPSRILITSYFDNIPSYRDRVKADFQGYLGIKGYFYEAGVSADVFQAFCQKFEATPEFEAKLTSNIEVLQKLSSGWDNARYVLSIVRHGFNLLDEQIMAMQMQDFKTCLSKLGINSSAERRFIFSIVPRINTDEALKMQAL